MDYVDRLRTLNGVWSPLGPLEHLQLRFPRVRCAGRVSEAAQRGPCCCGRGVPPDPCPFPPTRSVPLTPAPGASFPLFPGLGICRGSPLRPGRLQSPLPGEASRDSLAASGAEDQALGLCQQQPGPVHLWALPPSRAWAWAGTSLGPRPGNGGRGQSPDLHAETEGRAELGLEARREGHGGTGSSS